MNAELRRQVAIDVIDVYASISVKRKNSDIQNYLKENKQIPEIDRYLKAIGIFDKNRNLTEKGKEVKESGEFFQEEEGKYRFYILPNDPMLQTIVLYLHRQKTEQNQKAQGQNPYQELNNTSQQTIIKIQEQNQKVISNIQIKQMNQLYERIEIQELQLQWKFKLPKESSPKISTQYFFQGSIRGEIAQLNPFKFSYDLDRKILESMFEKLGYRLNIRNQVEVQFEKNKFEEEEWKSFRVFKIPVEDLDFGLGKWTGELRDIEIIPNNFENAKLWRDYLAELKLREKYFTEQNWDSVQEELTQKEAFQNYKIQPIDVKTKIKELSLPKEKSIEFFHLATPYHLNPYKKQKFLEKFTITENTTGSLEEIVLKKLHRPDHKILCLIYSDRYVQSSLQKQKFQEIVEYFNKQSSGLEVLLLSITDKKSDSSFSFSPNVTFTFKALEKNSDNHERFLLIQYENREWDIWKFTSGIDFYSKDNGSYKYKNCTFIRQEKTELPNYLKELLR